MEPPCESHKNGKSIPGMDLGLCLMVLGTQLHSKTDICSSETHHSPWWLVDPSLKTQMDELSGHLNARNKNPSELNTLCISAPQGLRPGLGPVWEWHRYHTAPLSSAKRQHVERVQKQYSVGILSIPYSGLAVGTTLSCLRSGHSDEDVDQMFGKLDEFGGSLCPQPRRLQLIRQWLWEWQRPYEKDRYCRLISCVTVSYYQRADAICRYSWYWSENAWGMGSPKHVFFKPSKSRDMTPALVWRLQDEPWTSPDLWGMFHGGANNLDEYQMVCI